MDRKEFLKSLVPPGGSSVVTTMNLVDSPGEDRTPIWLQFSVANLPRCSKRDQTFGGMGKYVKKGDRVVLSRRRLGSHAGTEQHEPELMVAVVKSCLGTGAKVVVFDHACITGRRATRTAVSKKP